MNRESASGPSYAEVDGALTADPQAIASADREEWRAVWESLPGRHAAPWRSGRLPPEAVLPMPTDLEIVQATMSFDVSTAVGIDALAPVWLRWLSMALLRDIARLFVILEAVGFWPAEVAAIVVCLIPKQSGGRRPIGVEPTLVRFWEKLRKPLVLLWREKVKRPYDAVMTRTPCEQFVYEQSVRDEAAQQRGDSSASCLLDIEKAFERVPLEHVYREGRRLGFPLAILRLILEACAFARYVTFERAVALPVSTLTAIIAGGAFATDMLFLVLVQPLDDVLVAFPAVRIYTVVDDVTIRAEGTEGAVATQLAGAVRHVIDHLETQVGMKVSRGAPWRPTPRTKSVAVSGEPATRKRIATSMRAMGVHVAVRVKNLGIDYAMGKEEG